jgi:ankyrin repeat protein
MRSVPVVAAAIILAVGLAVAPVAPVAAGSLHDAAMYGHLSTVKALLAAGANIDERDVLGHTPLHKAKNAEMAKFLIEAGAKFDTRNIMGQTPLHTAA